MTPLHSLSRALRRVIRRLTPLQLRRAIVQSTRWPPVGTVEMADLRRLTPISRSWGGDRGQPIDRYYVEAFLADHRADVKGRVLEIGDNVYTRQFGGERVTQSEILHAAPDNPAATYVDDLTTGASLPNDAFDCIVCTQTLHVIADMEAAIATLHRILRPGGVLLVTAPGISQIYRDEDGRWGDYWRLTDRSARWLFERTFGAQGVSVVQRGNVLSATAFLQGLASSELTRSELDFTDPDYQVSIGIRAVRSGG